MSTSDDFSKELREALGYTDEAPDDLVEMIMTGYDIAGLDITVAGLTYDSLQARDLVPVRTDHPPRMLTAEGGGFTIEFEIAADSQQLTGRVSPPTPGMIALDQLGNSQETDLHPSGAFAFLLGSGPFRLRLAPQVGEQVATEWLTHGLE